MRINSHFCSGNNIVVEGERFSTDFSVNGTDLENLSNDSLLIYNGLVVDKWIFKITG